MNSRVVERDEVPWVCAHEALSRLAKARASADVEEGRWLLAALRSAVHVHLGFGGFGEYVETARQLEELVAGKALGATPESPSDGSARRHVLR